MSIISTVGIRDDAITKGICEVYAKLHSPSDVNIGLEDRLLIRKYVKGACHTWKIGVRS